jgi:hypothetical protein
MKIIGFYHVADLPHWNEVMTDQMTKMSESGLLDRIDELHVCTNGNASSFIAAQHATKEFDNMHWQHVNQHSLIGEYPTLNVLKNYCDTHTEEFLVMYVHLKSLSGWGDANRQDWRHYMDYWQLERWEDCVRVLQQGYETAGINYNDQSNGQNDNWPHYSGNFWWARASYIRRLPQLNNPLELQWGTVSKLLHFPDGRGIPLDPGNYRYENEAWVGSGSPAYFELAHSPGKTDHDFHKNHPWPRERFEDNVNPLLPRNKVKDEN